MRTTFARAPPCMKDRISQFFIGGCGFSVEMQRGDEFTMSAVRFEWLARSLIGPTFTGGLAPVERG